MKKGIKMSKKEGSDRKDTATDQCPTSCSRPEGGGGGRGRVNRDQGPTTFSSAICPSTLKVFAFSSTWWPCRTRISLNTHSLAHFM